MQPRDLTEAEVMNLPAKDLARLVADEKRLSLETRHQIVKGAARRDDYDHIKALAANRIRRKRDLKLYTGLFVAALMIQLFLYPYTPGYRMDLYISGRIGGATGLSVIAMFCAAIGARGITSFGILATLGFLIYAHQIGLFVP